MVESLKQEKAVLQKELGARKLELPIKLDKSQVSSLRDDKVCTAVPIAE